MCTVQIYLRTKWKHLAFLTIFDDPGQRSTTRRRLRNGSWRAKPQLCQRYLACTRGCWNWGSRSCSSPASPRAWGRSLSTTWRRWATTLGRSSSSSKQKQPHHPVFDDFSTYSFRPKLKQQNTHRRRQTSESGTTAMVYKSKQRKELEEAGYRILGNMGDQWSDLLGTHVGNRTFKVPNPMFYIAWTSDHFFKSFSFDHRMSESMAR